jgi:hypothetical protein
MAQRPSQKLVPSTADSLGTCLEISSGCCLRLMILGRPISINTEIAYLEFSYWPIPLIPDRLRSYYPSSAYLMRTGSSEGLLRVKK